MLLVKLGELAVPLMVGGDTAGGTYNEGRLICRPDLVCVAVGAMSDSSELESPALITSLSLSWPRRRFLPRFPFVIDLRCLGAIGAFCCFPGIAEVAIWVVGAVTCNCGSTCRDGGCPLTDSGAIGNRSGKFELTSFGVGVPFVIFCGSAVDTLADKVWGAGAGFCGYDWTCGTEVDGASKGF